MAKNLVINGVTYASVPYVEIPISGSSQKAKFIDTTIDSDAADATTILQGKQAYVNGELKTGTITVPVISQDNSTKVLSIQ